MNRGITFLFLAALAAMTGCAAPATESASTNEQASTASRPTAPADDERADPVEVEGERGAPDARGATGSDPGVPTFADVEPILAATCTGCHRPTAFATVEKIRDQRAEMIARISTGAMPENDPDWFKTADGKLVLDFLRNSAEL